MTNRATIIPARDDLTGPYWDGTAAGELRLQGCARCSGVWHPPSPVCPHCHSLDYTWRPASGAGVVHSYTDVVHSVHEATLGRTPYRIVLVDLDEGPRLISGAVGKAAAIEELIGRRVCAVFKGSGPGGVVLPMFRLEDDELPS